MLRGATGRLAAHLVRHGLQLGVIFIYDYRQMEYEVNPVPAGKACPKAKERVPVGRNLCVKVSGAVQSVWVGLTQMIGV